MPQPFLPFDDPPAETPPAPHAAAIRYQPTQQALDAINRLRASLTDPPTPLAKEALYALQQALVKGRNAWFQAAENALEALALRNGRTQGDDIPSGQQLGEGPDFQQTIEDLLDCLHERFVGRAGQSM